MGLGLVRTAKTLSIMPTWQCTAACTDCGTMSHQREYTSLPLSTMLNAIEEASHLNFGNVVFTGGEPTLRWDDLLTAISFAERLNLKTRIVSNAWWAKSVEQARSRIKTLQAAGLNEINFSTGDEHARFVPIENVASAAFASIGLGLAPHVMVELRENRSVTAKTLLATHPLSTLPPDQLGKLSISESPWMPLEPTQIEVYPPGVAITKNNVGGCEGCDSVLQTYVLQANGHIGSCCGLGMRNLRELQSGLYHLQENNLEHAISTSEADFVKVGIRYFGPERLLAWASEIDPAIQWEGAYAHRCQTCIRFYTDPKVAKVVRDHFSEKLPELVATVALREVMIPQASQRMFAPGDSIVETILA
jgi:hypothetical protein